jgi:hypothetical protein
MTELTKHQVIGLIFGASPSKRLADALQGRAYGGVYWLDSCKCAPVACHSYERLQSLPSTTELMSARN